MAEIIAFPGEQEREWRVWEDVIRANPGSNVSQGAIEESLPAIKEHWTDIFQSVSLAVAPGGVPGPLNGAQAAAIEELMSKSVNVVIERLKHERAKALGKLIALEIMLARIRRGEL